MDESERLRASVKGRTRQAVKLGDVLSEFVEKRVLPRQARFKSIADLWSQLLPTELRQHCEITGISYRQLQVSVDSPLYANELRWRSGQLLEEIERRCPRARIKKIKLTVC